MAELEFDRAATFFRRCSTLDFQELLSFVPALSEMASAHLISGFQTTGRRRWECHMKPTEISLMVRSVLRARWTASGGLPQGLSGLGLEAAVEGYVAAAHKALASVLEAMVVDGRVPAQQQPVCDTVLLLLLAATGAAGACEALAGNRCAEKLAPSTLPCI